LTTFLRILRLIALSAWVGSIIFFVFGVAIVAFKLMPPAQAGLVVRNSLIALHRIGFIAGAVYFLCTLAILALQRDTHPFRAAELALVVAMLSLTAYLQMSLMPRMETDRLTLGGDITTAPLNSPQRQHFERLHGLSEKIEGAVLIEGLILLGLAPIHGRDDFDRFA
jgi:hypothetical protein